MSVTITDNRTIWSECDAADWVGPEPVTVVTTAPSPVELTGCLGFSVSQEINYSYYQTTATPMSGSLIYHWVTTQGTINTTENGGIQLIIGDGTNIIGFHIAGDDISAFRYDTSVPLWQCLVLDTSKANLFDNVNYFYTAWAGSLSGLITNLGSITQIGVGFGVASKALGGGLNCYADISRYGVNGLTITGGTTSARGNFYEIYQQDNNRTNQQSYGVIRELTTNVYGVQSPLTFGSDSGTSWFEDDSGSVIVFEDKLIGNDKYYFKVLGSNGTETHFILDGVSIVSAGPHVSCSFSSNDIDELSITNTSFKLLNREITFASDTSASFHTASNCTFDVCGQIDPGLIHFTDNTIRNSVNDDGSIIFTTNSIDVQDIDFTSDETGHAIYINYAGTYTFTNFTYTGFGGTHTTNAAVYNNSGGSVTINVDGGTSPTYRTGSDASVTINNPISYTISGLVVGSELRIYPTGSDSPDDELDGIESSSATFAYQYNYLEDQYVDIVVHHVQYNYIRLENIKMGNINSGTTIQQQLDRWYDNP